MTEVEEYELAVALGYEPESWTGIWSLVEHPFTACLGMVVAEQVITTGDQGFARLDADGNRMTRKIRHHLPDGWVIKRGTIRKFTA